MLSAKWFLHGLVSFLLAHIVYIIAFTISYSFSISGETLVIMLGIILIAVTFFRLLSQDVKRGGGGLLLIAVAVYIAVIATMLCLAILSGRGILIIAAVLFFISDAVLAINKFRGSFKIAEYIVMSTYFTAQLLFAISIGDLI
jgi:uncharacterized membrane protein YhhN